jgi:hypothetical protein
MNGCQPGDFVSITMSIGSAVLDQTANFDHSAVK